MANGARAIWIGLLAVVVVVASTFVVVPLAYVLLLIPFMEHDARGMPVEPRWTAWLAAHGGIALVSFAVGYVLGRASGFRLTHGLATGVAAAIGVVVSWYVRESLRGYEPGLVPASWGALDATLSVAPLMALGARAGFRSRD